MPSLKFKNLIYYLYFSNFDPLNFYFLPQLSLNYTFSNFDPLISMSKP